MNYRFKIHGTNMSLYQETNSVDTVMFWLDCGMIVVDMKERAMMQKDGELIRRVQYMGDKERG